MKINRLMAKHISYGGTRTAAQIKYLVYHFTNNRTDTAWANANYFAHSNTRYAGAQYFVDEKGAYQSVEDLRIAYAVGGSRQSSSGGSMFGVITNSNSISIEMCSTGGVIPVATMANAAALGKILMQRYHIPIERVYRHWDVNGKSCHGWNGWIGSNAPHWVKLKQMLQSNLSAAVVHYAVLTADANIRYKSGKDHPVIGTVKKGAKLQILRETGSWYQVAVWLPRKSTKDGRVLTDCNLRARAGKSQPVIGTYTAGKQINEQHHTDNWYQCAIWVPKRRCEKV